MNKHFYTLAILFLGFSIPSLNIFAQTATKPSFTIEGEVLRPLKFTLDDLSKMKQTEVKAKDKEGKEHAFKGVRLFDLLDSAGVTLGKDLRGENLAKYVLVRAVDGYKVIFSLPEIDPEFTTQTIIVAYEVDGNPLPKGEGAFRIVVPNDKRPTRWVRELASIKVVFSKE